MANPWWARLATARPMRPMPISPSTLPLSLVPSMWVGRHPVQAPVRTWRSPSPARRATISMSMIASSAVSSVSTSGVFVTTSPRACAALTSMWLNPTPKLARIEAGRPHDLGLLGGRVAEGRDDGAGVTHAPASGGRQSSDVADHRLRHVVADEQGGIRFLGPPDLTDQHDGLCLRVRFEQCQDVHKGAAVDGIAANPDASRDTDTERLHLRGRFIAKRARARDDADVARHVDVPWHDPQHRLAGADHTGAVGSDQPGATLLGIAPQVPLDPP